MGRGDVLYGVCYLWCDVCGVVRCVGYAVCGVWYVVGCAVCGVRCRDWWLCARVVISGGVSCMDCVGDLCGVLCADYGDGVVCAVCVVSSVGLVAVPVVCVCRECGVVCPFDVSGVYITCVVCDVRCENSSKLRTNYFVCNSPSGLLLKWF